jgi:hypothetical protein
LGSGMLGTDELLFIIPSSFFHTAGSMLLV